MPKQVENEREMIDTSQVRKNFQHYMIKRNTVCTRVYVTIDTSKKGHQYQRSKAVSSSFPFLVSIVNTAQPHFQEAIIHECNAYI